MFTGETFWLGTDDQGRDVFWPRSSMACASRFSWVSRRWRLALVLGVTLGLVAGYVGGWVETVIMRVADVQLTFPAILVAMLIFGIAKGITPPEYRDADGDLGADPRHRPVGLGAIRRASCGGATLVEKSKEYVQAARLIGPLAIRHHGAPHPAQTC